ncbi:MAG: RNA-guided pseudouridylation complex pseudouridine synthase subunit Cbf5 [Candidatus Aenigmarchaeota archaeon]|nr:RNA-guided pseudouridylation complex pseudouridine synthase subunit Cbf5 [Candidatus Aenigmarchaeota archaeon]
MQDFFIKEKAFSTTNHGLYPPSRTPEELLKNGIVVLDKPPGPTSHQVDRWIKELLGIPLCSHGGTLDPRVSGVLVIALQNATKLMPILLKSRKTYVTLVSFHKEVSEAQIREAVAAFTGKIKQLPPVKSAVARRVREREIYSIKIIEADSRNLLCEVECEAGTYIRRLADDFGKLLGTGAHMQELRRVKSGIFPESEVHTLQELADAFAEWKDGNEENLRKIVLPMERVADGMKVVIVKDSAVGALANGAPLAVQGISRAERGIERGNLVAVLSLKGEFVCFGPALMNSEDILKKKAGLAVKTDKVLIKKGTYPEKWK